MIATLQPEIWCIDLAAAAPALLQIERLTPRLADDEIARARALSDRTVREEWLATHIALRLLIERACGGQWRRVDFTRDERGKPRLDGAPITFSLSHAPGLALIAIAREGAIGVDIERMRTVRIAVARRDRIRAAGAGTCLEPLPDADDASFLQAWVRLEAFAKAEGCGIGRLLTRLGILGAGAEAPISAAEMHAKAAALVSASAIAAVRDLQLDAGTFAAAACPAARSDLPVSWLPTGSEQLQKLLI